MQVIIILLLIITTPTAWASLCPEDQEYEAYQTYGVPDNEPEKKKLIDRMEEDLKRSYPQANIICGVKDGKYLYCAACKEN